MKYLIPILLFLLSGQITAQQKADPWNTLAMVTLDSKYDDLLGMVVQKATPLPVVDPLNGTEITIRGYIIALSAKSNLKHFMFSRYPQNMCFFCGAAGPESAMQVFLKKGDSLNYTSDKVELKGTLNIQKGDSSGLIYTLQNAELVRIIK